MISILVFVVLVVVLLLIARRSSKNRDAILSEVILGIAGSVAAAVIVTSFPKIDTDNFLGYLDSQIYELVFGKKSGEAPKVPAADEKVIAITKNVSSDDRKIEGVYAGFVRAVQNGSDVLSEKAYILRVDPAKKDKILEIYQGGDIEYKIRIDGKLQKDGVTWVGETKSVLKGGTFVQDDLKLLLSPEVGRIDWHQHDKVQHIESIGTLYKIDEETVSERVRAINRIKNNIVICKEDSAKKGPDASQFLFVPIGSRAVSSAPSLEGPSYADKLFGQIISGYATPYEAPYDVHIKTRFKSNDFPNLTGMNMLQPDLSFFVGFFDKDYNIGVNRPGEEPTWFKQVFGETEPCRVFFVGFPPAAGVAPSVSPGPAGSPAPPGDP